MIDRRAIAARLRGLANVDTELLALAGELVSEIDEAEALSVLRSVVGYLATMQAANERARALAGDLRAILEEGGKRA